MYGKNRSGPLTLCQATSLKYIIVPMAEHLKASIIKKLALDSGYTTAKSLPSERRRPGSLGSITQIFKLSFREQNEACRIKSRSGAEIMRRRAPSHFQKK